MRIVVIISAFIALITGCTMHRSPSPVTAIVVPAGSITFTATNNLTAVSTNTPTPSISPTHTPAVTATGTPGCFVVTFPDPNLESVIRRKIGKPSGDIYNCDLAIIDEINEIDPYFEIKDLTGLEYCTNIESIFLSKFSGNTLAPLGTMKKMDYLSIYGDNQVLDITALSGLTLLREVILGHVDVVVTINSLSSLVNLVTLHLNIISLPNLSALSTLKNLLNLTVSAADLSDISGISGLTRLMDLEIDSGKINSLSDLSGLNLRSFKFSHRTVYRLRSLISDLSPFAAMTNLETFEICDVSVADVSPLSNCKSLKKIFFWDTLITNLNGLSALSNLDHVTFWGNLNLNDISGLTNSKNISSLTVSNSKITDISVISDLVSLSWIQFDNNMITDIHPAVLNAQNRPPFSSGFNLILRWNPLSDTALSEIELLENTYGVEVAY